MGAHVAVLWDQLVSGTPLLPPAAAVAALAGTCYVLFTPMHDASHSAIFTTRSGLGALNHVVGSVCATALMAPFAAFRYVHLEHHRHLNHPTKDPDQWSGSGPAWALPLRWATQNRHYEYVYISLLLRGARKWGETLEALATIAAVYGAFGYMCWAGHWRSAVAYWLLPAQIAITLLAFAFDYLPHRPHHTQQRMLATSVLQCGGWWDGVASVLLLNQNWHHVHHAFPWLPFYQYSAIHAAHSDDFAQAGTPVRGLLPLCPRRPEAGRDTQQPPCASDSDEEGQCTAQGEHSLRQRVTPESRH